MTSIRMLTRAVLVSGVLFTGCSGLRSESEADEIETLRALAAQRTAAGCVSSAART